MKIMTILGTRPEIIRLSLIIRKLDSYATKHILVHTGQNYDPQLSAVFFRQLGLRHPDYHIAADNTSLGAQIGVMFTEIAAIMDRERPDGVLVLGDTNSALCAVLAERMGIPVYHMEAGNRCYDVTVPEEINRKIIDSISSFNLPYTSLSRENLLREGVAPNRIWISGNPIFEVLQHFTPQIDSSDILHKLQLADKRYLLVTAHRAENVDNLERLTNILNALSELADQDLPIVCSVHPRTRERMRRFGLQVTNPHIHFSAPFGFFDFVHLQKHARCVLTDSGTVQEECCLSGVPTVTVRQSTERPETVQCGSNILSGLNARHIVECVHLALQTPCTWSLPEGYADPNVSTKITHFILGGLRYV